MHFLQYDHTLLLLGKSFNWNYPEVIIQSLMERLKFIKILAEKSVNGSNDTLFLSDSNFRMKTFMGSVSIWVVESTGWSAEKSRNKKKTWKISLDE